ncbi:unannotated protein [freshwater metagenome]|uniref:Unannotated protein n=1 Tax=freshwater metagenome TaxID=449393 RepID=A0A6J6YUC4_9ZZZZ
MRKFPGVKFAKLLGTGKGITFTPLDASALRWGILLTINQSDLNKFEQSSIIKSWQRIANSSYTAKLKPISSHGFWSKQQPFEIEDTPWQGDGKIVAITRARIAWLQNMKFWRAVPPVTNSLHNSPGLIAAIGIGEAPIGLQGTFSIWQDSASLRNFAYKGEAHSRAITATAENEWYSEELFARFALLAESGELL